MPADNESARRRRRWIELFIVALIPCVALAQQQPTQKPADSDEVLRVTTELVQTDVSVLDKSGKFVDGLRPEQFTLKVDGRPQAISFFERVVAGSVNEDAQIAAARGAARSGAGSSAAPVPLDRGRAVVFFLDDYHMSLQSTARTRELLRRFIDNSLGQNDQMAVVTSTNQLGFLSQLTDDRSVLREAVSRVVAKPVADIIDREEPWMNVAQAQALERREPDITDSFIEQTMREHPEMRQDQAREYVQRRADVLIDQNTAIVQRTLDSLRGVLRAFAAYPGRKLFYFVSDGFALDFQRNNTYDRIRTITDAAVRAGAVIYTIDARGIAAQLTDLPRAEDGYSFDPANRMNGATVSLTSALQEPLRTIADETGGRAILNTDSIEAGVGRALKETSVYYLLAWRPDHDENRGGRFRRLEVSVKDRPDLTVLVQRGFFGSPPPEPARPAQKGAQAGAASQQADGASGRTPEQQARAKELFAALRSPFPRAEVPTAVTLNYVKGQADDITLSMSVQIEIETGEAAPGAAPAPDQAQVIGALYDDHGKVVNSFERSVTITPGNAPAKDAGAPGPNAEQPARPVPANAMRLTLAFQSPVKPGLYEARFASLDPKSHRTGSAVQWINVPDVAGKGFAVSSIFLGVRPQAASTQANATGQPAEPAPQVLVVPDRRFSRDPHVRFLIYAYNAAAGSDGRPDVGVQVQVFRDDQPVITAPLRKLNADAFKDISRLPYAAEISLQGMPAGHYQLRVTAIDRVARASAAQSIKFTIE